MDEPPNTRPRRARRVDVEMWRRMPPRNVWMGVNIVRWAQDCGCLY
jgi:hypothetical protein